MSRILPLGETIKLDDNNKFINPCSIDKIFSPWSEVIDDVIKTYRDNMGDRLRSVYVRGSIARGTAVSGVSDVDTFAVISGSRWQHDLSWVNTEQEKLNKKYPFQTGVEIQLITEDELAAVSAKDSITFTIKVLSVCVWGDDVSTTIADFEYGLYLAEDLKTFEPGLQQLTQIIISKGLGEHTHKAVQWIMKSIVRNGFYLVMEKESVYCRDLYPCYTAFIKHYPEQKEAMTFALEQAIKPDASQDDILDFLDTFGSWMTKEINNIFFKTELTN